MGKILIEAEVNPKLLKTMKILAIVFMVMVVTIPAGIIILLVSSGAKQQRLIVSEKSIQGNYGTIMKKTINLPIDSINSVECYPKAGSIIISTSSNTIRFQNLANSKEVTDVINSLIGKRNNNSTTVINTKSDADELAKYKELLDKGIISKEEFDAKKKQLLGL